MISSISSSVQRVRQSVRTEQKARSALQAHRVEVRRISANCVRRHDCVSACSVLGRTSSRDICPPPQILRHRVVARNLVQKLILPSVHRASPTENAKTPSGPTPPAMVAPMPRHVDPLSRRDERAVESRSAVSITAA